MYEFTEDCMLHIDAIDEEHKRLFQMINEAFELVEKTEDVTAIGQSLIANLKDYAATHLAHEEAYMESIHDPELPLQKTEHAAFAKTINEFKLDTTSPRNAKRSLNELLTYLVHWLYHHILSSDMMIKEENADETIIEEAVDESAEGGEADVETEESTEDPFAFTDKYKTGITFVDDEHRKLFEIISDTNDLIHDQLLHDKYDEIMRLLAELRDYTELHFSEEEALMERIHYPELPSQKRAHAAFVDRLVNIDLDEMEDLDDNQQVYLLDLIQFLLNWLANHILACDKKIGEYMRENHISE